MKKGIGLFLLCFAMMLDSYALSSCTAICYAEGANSFVKFYFDYDGANYHFCVRNTDGKKSVLEKGDKYIFQTDGGQQYVVNVTDDVFNSETSDGYYLQIITPKELNVLSEGISKVQLYRNGISYSFELIPYSKKVAKKEAVNIQTKSKSIDRMLVREDIKRQKAILQEERKVKWQAKQDSVLAVKEALALAKKEKAEALAAAKKEQQAIQALEKEKQKEMVAVEKQKQKEATKEKFGNDVLPKVKTEKISKKKSKSEDDYWRLAHPDL